MCGITVYADRLCMPYTPYVLYAGGVNQIPMRTRYFRRKTELLFCRWHSCAPYKGAMHIHFSVVMAKCCVCARYSRTFSRAQPVALPHPIGNMLTIITIRSTISAMKSQTWLALDGMFVSKAVSNKQSYYYCARCTRAASDECRSKYSQGLADGTLFVVPCATAPVAPTKLCTAYLSNKQHVCKYGRTGFLERAIGVSLNLSIGL